MRSQTISLLALTLSLGAGAVHAQPGRPIRVQTVAPAEHFGRRVVPQEAVTRDAASVIRVDPRLVRRPAPPSPALPGTEYATVAAEGLSVEGKLEAQGFGVLVANLDHRFFLLPSNILVPPPPPEPSPLPISTQPHLRLIIQATEGAFYIISCKVSGGGSYRIRQGLMVESSAPEIARSADSSGNLIFHLDNAAGGKNYFSIHATSLWTWQSCQVNQLS